MNNRGSVLFIAVALIAVVSILAAGYVFSRSQGLATVSATYRQQAQAEQLTQELTVIFANPRLCRSLVFISGNSFRVGNIYVPPTSSQNITALFGNPNVGIQQMVIENTSFTTESLWKSDFSIITQELNNPKGVVTRKNTVSALYDTDPTGRLTDCRLLVKAENACRELGFEWSASDLRCKMCEKMGGTWLSSVCSLVPEGP